MFLRVQFPLHHNVQTMAWRWTGDTYWRPNHWRVYAALGLNKLRCVNPKYIWIPYIELFQCYNHLWFGMELFYPHPSRWFHGHWVIIWLLQSVQGDGSEELYHTHTVSSYLSFIIWLLQSVQGDGSEELYHTHTVSSYLSFIIWLLQSVQGDGSEELYHTHTVSSYLSFIIWLLQSVQGDGSEELYHTHTVSSYLSFVGITTSVTGA